MDVLLSVLAQLRENSAIRSPNIVSCGTKGMRKLGRDVSVLIVSVYTMLLKA